MKVLFFYQILLIKYYLFNEKISLSDEKIQWTYVYEVKITSHWDLIKNYEKNRLLIYQSDHFESIVS